MLFFALLTAGVLCAATRTADEAMAIARRVALRRAPVQAEAAGERILRETNAYFAVRTGGSLVIVAADDAQPEVLGYSANGAFETDEFPPAMEAWLGSYDHAPAFMETVADACAPIVQCHWNQTAPYNNLTPLYDATNHCVTGCTATAMAQLMYTHRHPARGTGSASYFWECPFDNSQSRTLSADFGNTVYDWNNMLPSYDVSHTPQQETAVATLMYHCGVAIGVSYGISGSSGTDNSVLRGLFTYFGYDHNIRMLPKDYHAVEYIAGELRDELRAGRPVYVSGRGGGGGHAFICDGFSADGYFHFNWGWGGLGDGEYLLTGLNPTQQGTGANQMGDYNSEVLFATGIRPATGSTDTLCQLSVSKVQLTSSEVPLGQPADAQLLIVRNYGLHTFGGTYSVGLLAEDGRTLVYELANASRIGNPLPPSYYFTTPLEFRISFPLSLTDGVYYLCGLYRHPGETEPHIMDEYGGKPAARIEVRAGMAVSTAEENESPVNLAVDSVTCNVSQVQRAGNMQLTAHRLINIGTETFSGNIGAVLLDNSRREIRTVLTEHPQLIALPSNYFITTPVTLSFSVPSDVPDGEYYLTFAHHHSQSKWKPVQRHPDSSGTVLIKLHIQNDRISLTPSSETPVMALEQVFDTDGPAEIYTLTGQRITSEQMRPSQVYIIHQGGKTFKVRY